MERNNQLRIYSGKVLRAIRKARGYSAEEIAEKIQINPQTIYGYERGLYMPKMDCSAKLFGYLEIKQPRFQNVCRFNFRSGKSVEQTAQQIIENPETEKHEFPPEESYDEMVISAVRHGLKNLSAEEKTILFRMIVNFTTQPVKKAYYHE